MLSVAHELVHVRQQVGQLVEQLAEVRQQRWQLRDQYWHVWTDLIQALNHARQVRAEPMHVRLQPMLVWQQLGVAEEFRIWAGRAGDPRERLRHRAREAQAQRAEAEGGRGDQHAHRLWRHPTQISVSARRPLASSEALRRRRLKRRWRTQRKDLRRPDALS